MPPRISRGGIVRCKRDVKKVQTAKAHQYRYIDTIKFKKSGIGENSYVRIFCYICAFATNKLRLSTYLCTPSGNPRQAVAQFVRSESFFPIPYFYPLEKECYTCVL